MRRGEGLRDVEQSGAPAVTRAAGVLRLLARSETPLGVNMIAKTLDLVPSTCLHVLRALTAEGFVQVDPDSKRYSLDVGLLPIAYRLMRQDDFSQRAAPILSDVARRFDVTAIGVRVTGLRHMVVVAVRQPETAFRLHVDVGSHFPGLISATGRCNAAFGGHDATDLKQAFERLKWDSPPGYAQWKREVADVREAGFSVDAGSYMRGVAIVAAPVLDRHGQMSHGLTAIGLSERLGEGATLEIGEALKAGAARLSGPASSGDADLP